MVKGVLARVHRGDDGRFVVVRLDQTLLIGIGDPLQLLVGAVVGIGEQRIELGIEQLRTAAIRLRDEGVVEVRELLVVLVDDRLIHAAGLQLLGRRRHLLPGRGHGDAGIGEDLLVVDEADRV
jgi:hypothetical protein